MTMIAAPRRSVKPSPAKLHPDAATRREPRPFGEGILPDVSRLARRGPTSIDRAWKNGFDVALECEGPVEPPAGYTEAERSAFRLGLAEGAAVAHARELAHLDDVAEKAECDDRMSTGCY